MIEEDTRYQPLTSVHTEQVRNIHKYIMGVIPTLKAYEVICQFLWRT